MCSVSLCAAFIPPAQPPCFPLTLSLIRYIILQIHQRGAVRVERLKQEKKKKRTKCFYLFIWLRIHQVVLWWPGPSGTQKAEFALWIIWAPVHIIFLRSKTSRANSASTELWDCKSFGFMVSNLLHCLKWLFDTSRNWQVNFSFPVQAVFIMHARATLSATTSQIILIEQDGKTGAVPVNDRVGHLVCYNFF